MGGNRVILTILLTAMVSTAYGMGIYLFGTLLPDMRASLGLTPEMIGRIAGSAQAGTIVASLLIGFVWVRIGAKETILTAQAVIAVTMVLIGLSTQPWQLMILLSVLGATAASSWIPIVPLVQAVIPEERRGVALGLISSGLAYGVFVVGLVAPFLIATAGWRSVWFAAGGLAFVFLLTGLVVFAGLPKIRQDKDRPLELSAGHSALSVAGMLMIAVNFLTGLAFHPFQTYLTLLFRDLHHWTMPAATALWSAIGFGGMIGGLAFGLLADRIGAKWTLVLSYVVLFGACLTTVLLATELPVYAAMVLFGMTYNAIWGLFAAWISKRFSASAAARLMGFTLVSSGIGATSGNYFGGIFTGLPGGFTFLYVAIATIVGVILVLSFFLPTDHPDGRHAALDPHNPPA